MAREHIDLGTPNGQNGFFIRDAFDDVNKNFIELYEPEWMRFSGTRAGIDLIVNIGDFDMSGSSFMVTVDTTDDRFKFGEGTNQGFLESNKLGLVSGGFTGNVNFIGATSNQSYLLPDKSGTFAMLSDINPEDWYKVEGSKLTGDLIITLGDYDGINNETTLTVNAVDETIVASTTIVTPEVLFYDKENDKGIALKYDDVVANRYVEFQDKSGTLALLEDMGLSEWYTFSGVRSNGTLKAMLGDYDLTGHLNRLVIDDENYRFSFQGDDTNLDFPGTHIWVGIGDLYFMNENTYDDITAGSARAKFNFEPIHTGLISWTLPKQSGTLALIEDIPAMGPSIVGIDEGNGIGFVSSVIDRSLVGNIGLGALDLSFNNTAASSVFGARGDGSWLLPSTDATASGYRAGGAGYLLNLTGTFAVGFGYDINASGYTSFSTGTFITNGGTTGYSLAGGQGVVNTGNANIIYGAALSNGGVGTAIFGAANTNVPSSNNGSSGTNPMIIVGNGTHTTAPGVEWTATSRSNLLVGYRNGEFVLPSTSIAVIDSESTGKQVITKEWADSKFISDVSNIAPISTADTGTTISLASSGGNYCNMASPNTNTTYSFTGEVLGGWAKVRINLATEPAVTGATKISSPAFQANTDMYLIVEYNGNITEYSFLEI